MFGPIVFAVLLVAMFRIASPVMERADRLMLAFAIPPLVLVTGVGFVTRALANWAAPSFVSGMVVAIALLVRRGAWRWLALSLGIGVAAQGLVLAGDAMATRLNVAWLANGDIYHRTLGWRALGERAGALARQVGARTIVAESRDDEASLIYYWRDQPEQVLAWPLRADPDASIRIDARTDGRGAAADPVREPLPIERPPGRAILDCRAARFLRGADRPDLRAHLLRVQTRRAARFHSPAASVLIVPASPSEQGPTVVSPCRTMNELQFR